MNLASRAHRPFAAAAIAIIFTISGGAACQVGDPADQEEPDLGEEPAVAGGVHVLAPDADTEVRQASPNTSYGSSPELGSDGDPVRHAYLRFDLRGLSGAVQRATLGCQLASGSVDGPAVYATSSSWSESTMTWNTRPAPSGSRVADLGSVAYGSWIEVDVTAAVRTGQLASLVLVPTSTDSMICASRESSTLRPELSVELAASTACPTFGSRAALGTPGLAEASGLVASRTQANILWSHNDSGSPEHLHPIDARNGRVLGRYRVSDADNGDWEDIAVGPGPVSGRDYIYVGRIGSAAGRKEIVRVAEPVTTAGQQPVDVRLSGVERFPIAFPSNAGSNDAESMFVDPVDGAVYVVTKNYAGHSKVLRYQPPFDPATTRVLEVVVDDLPFNPSSATPNDRLATAADISPTGREILIKTYNQTYLWRRASGQSVADALRQSRCQVTHPGGSEAIAFSADESRYYSLTEGSGSLLYQVPRL